jgi:hypothetical protein
MKPRGPRLSRLAVAAAGLAALIGVPASSASNVTVIVVVNPGPLSVGVNGSATIRLTVGGTRTKNRIVIPLTLADDTGSGNGWHLTIRGTAFSTGGTSPKILPAGSLTVPQLTVSCASGTTCAPPANAVKYPVVVPMGTSPDTWANLLSAAPGSGLGMFTVGVVIRVKLPATTRAGAYSGELTLALVSGP